MDLNINNYITIYPNEKGWKYIKMELLTLYHSVHSTYGDFEEFFQRKQTKDGGYREQMWTLIEDVPMLFHQSTDYLKTTIINYEKV